MDPVESWARVFKFTKELRGGTNLSLFYSWKTWNCDCPKQKEMNIGKSFEIFTTSRSSRPEVKKLFLKMSQNWPENTSVRFTFLIKLQASPLEKETQVFSREFCEIFRNPFFKVHLRWLPLNIHVDMMFFLMNKFYKLFNIQQMRSNTLSSWHRLSVIKTGNRLRESEPLNSSNLLIQIWCEVETYTNEPPW